MVACYSKLAGGVRVAVTSPCALGTAQAIPRSCHTLSCAMVLLLNPDSWTRSTRRRCPDALPLSGGACMAAARGARKTPFYFARHVFFRTIAASHVVSMPQNNQLLKMCRCPPSSAGHGASHPQGSAPGLRQLRLGGWTSHPPLSHFAMEPDCFVSTHILRIHLCWPTELSRLCRFILLRGPTRGGMLRSAP